MFKKTSDKSQLGVFSHPGSFLTDRSERYYEEQGAWHNLFRSQVTFRIEESLFEPLYAKKTGSPNASVRIMVAMMILKEANGWSDSQLYEQCRFNLLVRRSLGLINLDDPIPTESTYYLFRKRIVEHEREGNANLLEATFTAVTKGQATDFQVSGRRIRMDSKLLGSNIAFLSRYELVHESLRLFCDKTSLSRLEGSLPAEQMDLLKSLLAEKGNKVVYRNSSEEVRGRLIELGRLAYRLLEIFKGSCSPHYQMMARLFAEQFEVDEQKLVMARAKESISATSLQSPHDTDAHYRNKDGHQVKGYSVNVTESCEKEGLNLISSVEVKQADAADNGFLEKGLLQAEEVFGEAVENIHADGAYHSPSNQELVGQKNATLILNAIQGPKGRYDLKLNEDGTLTVTDLQTATTIEALRMKNAEKWRIKTAKHYRYFTIKQIRVCELRKKIAAIPGQILNIRNNVEATIFQLGYHYPNDKTRYRGLIKHKMWANTRCLWVNFVRILKYRLKREQKTNLQSIIRPILMPESFKNQFVAKAKVALSIKFINRHLRFPKTQIATLY